MKTVRPRGRVNNHEFDLLDGAGEGCWIRVRRSLGPPTQTNGQTDLGPACCVSKALARIIIVN